MGVGVYVSDFGSAGSTFLVSGPLATDDEYQNYVKEAEDPLDQTEWATQEWDDFTSDMSDTIADALKQVGFFPIDHRRGYTRATFDSDFVGCSQNGLVEIGWRSWESDLVIGIAGCCRWQETMADPGAYVEDFAAEQGMDPEKAKPIYLELVEAVQDYVRLALQEANFECRYRTSGYTTDRYEPEADPTGRMQELAGTITDRVQVLAKRFDQRVTEMDRPARIEFAEMIEKERLQIATEVPFFDHRSGEIKLSDRDGGLLYGRFDTPSEEVGAYLDGLKVEGGADISPIPLVQETEELYRILRADRAPYGNFLLSPDEFVEAFDDDLAASYEDAGGNRIMVTFDAPTTAPTVSP